MARQISFRLLEEGADDICLGILFDERWIICGCCGAVIDAYEEDVEILQEFDEWCPLVCAYEIYG